MQRTYAQRREEMKARLAANTKSRLAIQAGKRIVDGRYTFVVASDNEYGTEIKVEYNSKPFRTIAIDKRAEFIRCKYGYEMTAPLLKAVVQNFITMENTGAKDSTHLLLHRAVWFSHSNHIGTRVRKAFPNPFGV